MSQAITIYLTEAKILSNIILIIISIILAIIAIIYKIKSSFIASMSTFIKTLEKMEFLSGEQKMNILIGWIRNMIPRIFNIVFNDKTLRQIAQNIYDDMEEYRDNYIKRKTGITTQELIQKINETNNKQVEE